MIAVHIILNWTIRKSASYIHFLCIRVCYHKCRFWPHPKSLGIHLHSLIPVHMIMILLIHSSHSLRSDKHNCTKVRSIWHVHQAHIQRQTWSGPVFFYMIPKCLPNPFTIEFHQTTRRESFGERVYHIQCTIYRIKKISVPKIGQHMHQAHLVSMSM